MLAVLEVSHLGDTGGGKTNRFLTAYKIKPDVSGSQSRADPLRRPGHNLCSQTILLSHIISGGDEKKNSDITENILINRVNLWRPISREITLSREMSVRSPAGSWQHGAAPGHSLASPRQPRTAVTILCANLKKNF